MKHNIDSRTNVDIKLIHPNYPVNIIILTVGSYSITNKTKKTNLAKTSGKIAADLSNFQNRNFVLKSLDPQKYFCTKQQFCIGIFNLINN